MLMNCVFALESAFLQDSYQLFYGLGMTHLVAMLSQMFVVGEGPGVTLSILEHFLSLISSLLIGI